MAHVVGVASEFELIISITTIGGDTLVNADALPTVDIKDSSGAVVASFAGPVQILHPSLGLYQITWTPLAAGDYTAEWSFLYNGNPLTSIESFCVFTVGSVPSLIPSAGPGYVVSIIVVDEAGVPVEGMTVQIYDETGVTLIASGVTDVTGEALVTPPTDRYQVRFCGDHILAEVVSPQQIKVIVPPPNNRWIFTATTFIPPVSANPNMCRCWGFFVDAAGRPCPNLYLRLQPVFDPAALYVQAVGYAQKPVELTTDEDGFFSVDLVRGGLFNVTLSGYMDSAPNIRIPDASSCNIVDILFPAPSEVTFDPVGPIALVSGSNVNIEASLLMSDGRTLNNTSDPSQQTFVEYTSSDIDVFTVEGTDGESIVVQAVGAGVATLSAVTVPLSFLPRVPAVVLTITPIVVTVT